MSGGVSVTIGGEALSDIPSRVAGISITRGRQDELERTGTGTATVSLNYTSGSISEFVGESAEIALTNPLGGDSTIFAGIVDEVVLDFHPSQVVTRAEVQLVDVLDRLASIELAPGLFGVVPLPAGVLAGNIFYEEATVQDRIFTALAEAEITDLGEIFTGNVRVRDTIYAPRTSLLTVIHDAADAEFPGVANFYAQRTGEPAFHGRLARFNPGDPQYAIATYKAGDQAAWSSDLTRAQLRGLRMARSRKHIINAALATPEGIADADIAGQVVSDAFSIAAYGNRSWSAENLLTFFDKLNNLTANAAVKQFAQYHVDNYALPRTRVEECVFRSILPSHPVAGPTWSLLTTVEISDILNLAVGGSPGASVGEDFFVEGVRYEIQPLNESYADVTLRLDLSPRSHWNTAF